MSSSLSVFSLHLKEVGSSIPTTTADHVSSCTPASTNTHIWGFRSQICWISQAKDATETCLTFLLTQTLNKLCLRLVSTDYVRYFTRQALDSVLKKLELTLNRSFDWKTDTKKPRRRALNGRSVNYVIRFKS